MTQLKRSISGVGRRKGRRLCCILGATTIALCLIHYLLKETAPNYYYYLPPGLRDYYLTISTTAYRQLVDNPVAPHLLDNMIGVEIAVVHLDKEEQQQPARLPIPRQQQQRKAEFTVSVLSTSKYYYLLNSSLWQPPAALPFTTGSMDFVLAASAVVEQLTADGSENGQPQQQVNAQFTMSLTKAIDDWLRVVRSGGYVYLVLPSRRRGLFDRERNVSTLAQLLSQPGEGKDAGHEGEENGVDEDLLLLNSMKTWSAHPTNDFLLTCIYRGWEVYAMLDNDNYMHDVFTVILRKK